MEVKIKDNDKLVDATIEVVDGVMVVSPKEEKWIPKDGDVVFSGTSLISIFKEMSSGTSLASYASLSDGKFEKEFDYWSASNIRPATEEEKKELFDKLKEEGLEWDAEKKKLVKLKWKPKYNEEYWCPAWMYSDSVVPYRSRWTNSNADNIYQNKSWIFRTEEECQEFCNKLNQAINQIKP